MWQAIETAPKVMPDNCRLLMAGADGRMIFMEWCEDGLDQDHKPWSGWVCEDGNAPDEHNGAEGFVPEQWFLVPEPPVAGFRALSQEGGR